MQKLLKTFNYNILSTPNINDFIKDNIHLDICPRAKLDTGTFCNYKCEFCYYKNELDKMTSFEIIKKRLNVIRKYNLIKEIELSGGESSIHPDWFKILKECSLTYNHISTLSNGSKFKNKRFLKKSKKYGLKEILFSVHGYENIHDKIVGHKNAFKNIDKAIHNALEEDLIVRINCTICNHNAQNFEDFLKYEIYIRDLISKGIKQLNFIFLNFWDNNNNDKMTYQDYMINVQNAIQMADSILIMYPEFDIRFRYIPYCLLSPNQLNKHKNRIYGQFQHIFDLTDWNKEIYDTNNFRNFSNIDKKESLIYAYNEAKKSRESDYYKIRDCVHCKYFKDCDGPEKQLKDFKFKPFID